MTHPQILPTSDLSTWANQQWGTCKLGDRRLVARAVLMGERMAAHPDWSLTRQMGERKAAVGAYRLLGNPRATLFNLCAPHQLATLAAASQAQVVLFIQDWTTLDYSAHPSTHGLGPVGSRRQRGMLLHSVLAVTPEERQILGWAHGEILLRPEQSKGRRHRAREAETEADAWERGAEAVGAPPPGRRWIHVSDRESDIFEYWQVCRRLHKGFVVRGHHNRRLWDEEHGRVATGHFLDVVRAWPAAAEPGATYPVEVAATKKTPARTAQICVAWGQVTLAAPEYVRLDKFIRVWAVRAWEPNPPPGAEPVEWVLCTSEPVENLAQALQIIDWYTCRWLVEDFHMCLKTGCRVEHSQLDQALDLQRLLGFVIPIAARLLQIRQASRASPAQLASTVVEPLVVRVLAKYFQVPVESITLPVFWRYLAQLGGHQGRKSDGAPGWRTIWKGWMLVADWTEGARLFVT